MTTFFVLAFLRCGHTTCSIFFPLPDFHYAQVETCREDAQRLTPPPGATIECMAVEQKLAAARPPT